jgi:hypothetical protein
LPTQNPSSEALCSVADLEKSISEIKLMPLMNWWLQNFAYKTEMAYLALLLAGQQH